MADPTQRQPRTKPPEQRRDDLMNAAQRLFLDLGVSATTVEQITSGAGVAKGREIPRLDMIDIHPTVMKLLGLQPGRPVDGKPVDALFAQ